ncbi:MAG: substrate-binding domain-containing protein [Chloroflexota bacterium]
MRRLITGAVALALTAGLTIAPVAAQDEASEAVFSDEVLECAQDLRIFHVPKFTGFIFFELAREGVNRAAAEFGAAEPVYIGPDKADTQQQVQVIQNIIPQQPDVIVLASLDLNALSPSLKEARDNGAVVVTYDADVSADARDLFTNMMTFPQQAQAMLDSALVNDAAGGTAIWLAPTPTTANFISQKAAIDELIAADPEKYGNIEFIDTLFMEDDPELSKRVATDAMAANPDLKYFISGSGMANPAVNQAIIDTGNSGDVYATGFALPSTMLTYLEDGTNKQYALWNPVDFGYLATVAGVLKKCGAIEGADGETFVGGTLGERTIGNEGEIVLGVPMFFTPECPDFDSCPAS